MGYPTFTTYDFFWHCQIKDCCYNCVSGVFRISKERKQTALRVSAGVDVGQLPKGMRM